MARNKKPIFHRRETGGGAKTACGLMVYTVASAVKETWAGVGCKRCLRVKEAEAKAKAAKKAKKAKKGGRR